MSSRRYRALVEMVVKSLQKSRSSPGFYSLVVGLNHSIINYKFCLFGYFSVGTFTLLGGYSLESLEEQYRLAKCQLSS